MWAQTSAPLLRQNPPVVFEPNRGQAPKNIKWIAQGRGYGFLFTRDGLSINLTEQSATPKPGMRQKGHTLSLKFDGGRSWDEISGIQPTGGLSNYLHRSTGPKSITGIPHYARLHLKDVYPGVDADFYNDNGNLEYDFVVRPGADPNQIRVALNGQQGLSIDAHSGDLIAQLSDGTRLHHQKPKVYQQSGSRRVEIPARYALVSQNVSTFELGKYDSTKPLVIDPSLQVVQFVGHTSYGRAIAVDLSGNAYVTGNTGPNLPVTNGSRYDDGEKHRGVLEWIFDTISDFPHWGAGFEAKPADYAPDNFVAKLSPSGSILFSTYFGLGDATGIAVDSTGVVVTGWSRQSPSADVGNGNGIFVAKLSLTGSDIFDQVLYQSDDDMATGVALDSQHNAWVSGFTSNSYILHKTVKPENPDALLIKVDPQGVARLFKTWGGEGADLANGVAVDRSNNVWIVGQTCSADFPNTFNQGLRGQKCAGFVSKLLTQTNTIKFTSLIGAGEKDAVNAVTVDARNIGYIAGQTNGFYTPTSSNAFQREPTGPFSQGFVMQMGDDGTSVRSTLIGTDSGTSLNALAVNGAGEVYAGGITSGSTFPGNGPLQSHPSSGIIMKFSPDLSTVVYSRQQGLYISSVALWEQLVGATPAKVYTTGYERLNTGAGDQTRAFVDVMIDDLQYVRIRNYWKPSEYINIETGTPTSGPIQPGWYSARWRLEQPFANTFWIRNFWMDTKYLNINNGLQSTTIGVDFPGGRWTLEPVDGRQNIYRIRNVGNPSLYLNNQNGALVATPIEIGWYSAMWVMESVF